jgi:hypothetical protein
VKDRTKIFEYISSRGVKAVFSPMPPYMRELTKNILTEEGRPEPKKPTYIVDASGDEVAFEHDESTVTTEDEKELWADWKVKHQEWELDFHRRLNRDCQIDCMELVDVDWKVWQGKMKAKGATIPEDEIERKLMYIRYEFIGTQEDLMSIVAIPSLLSLEGGIVGNAADAIFQKQYKVEKQPAAPGTDNNEKELDV